MSNYARAKPGQANDGRDESQAPHGEAEADQEGSRGVKTDKPLLDELPPWVSVGLLHANVVLKSTQSSCHEFAH